MVIFMSGIEYNGSIYDAQEYYYQEMMKVAENIEQKENL